MTRSLRLLFYACALLHSYVEALSSPPLDLLAYPAYTIQLRPDKPISNSSASRILAGNAEAASSTTPNELQLKTQSPLQGSGGAEPASLKPYLLRSAVNGQAYLCSVPEHQHASPSHNEEVQEAHHRHQLTTEERNELRRKHEDEKRQAYERGLALLEPLKGTCLYLSQGWFTYQFCHGSEIRQFHAIRVPNANGHGTSIAEDLTQDSYTLGLFNNRIVEDEGLVDTKKARALGTLREVLESEDKDLPSSLDILGDDSTLGGQKRYLVQSWTGGTLCDKTGVDRRIEVQFHCNSQTTDRIFLIRETAICEYVMVIHTPRLCGEPVFVGSRGEEEEAANERKRKSLSVVDCRPVVRDETIFLAEQARRKRAETPQVAGSVKAVGSPASGLALSAGSTGDLQIDDTQPLPEVALDAGTLADQSKSQAATPQDTDAHADPSASAEQDTNPDMNAEEDILLDSFLLVIDPNTGEIVLQPDDEAVPASMNAEESGDEERLQRMGDMVKVLRENLETAIGKLKDNPEVSAVLKRLEVQGQPDLLQQHRDSVQQGQQRGQQQQQQVPANQDRHTLAGKKASDHTMRLKQAGAHNHKAIAEQFLKGQLKQDRKPRVGHAARHGHEAGRLEQEQRLGTSQHRDLKKAFGVNWDDQNKDDDSKERRRDEL